MARSHLLGGSGLRFGAGLGGPELRGAGPMSARLAAVAMVFVAIGAMGLATLGLAAAPLGAQDTAAPEHFRPMAFLVGSCWKGTFPDGKATDEHCYEWVYGKFIRDRHVVTGPQPDYRGETLYAFDAEQKKVVYWYLASPGFFTTGTLEYTDEGIVFPEKVVSDSGTKEMKNIFQRVEASDAYRVKSMEKTPAGWKELWTMELKRQPPR